jgi:hypothetical protein
MTARCPDCGHYHDELLPCWCECWCKGCGEFVVSRDGSRLCEWCQDRTECEICGCRFHARPGETICEECAQALAEIEPAEKGAA